MEHCNSTKTQKPCPCLRGHPPAVLQRPSTNHEGPELFSKQSFCSGRVGSARPGGAAQLTAGQGLHKTWCCWGHPCQPPHITPWLCLMLPALSQPTFAQTAVGMGGQWALPPPLPFWGSCKSGGCHRARGAGWGTDTTHQLRAAQGAVSHHLQGSVTPGGVAATSSVLRSTWL